MRVLVGVAVVLLVSAWLLALRAHLRRQRDHATDWQDAQQRPDLWTSSARCVSCGAGGGVLERDDDRLWFVCMRCGHRQARSTPG